MPPWGNFAFLEPSCLFFLLVGATLFYAGGCTLNDAFDAEFDRRYNEERPLPSGRISQEAVWALGLLELAVGGGILVFGAACSLKWVLLLSFSVLAYDYLHKRWQGSFLLMGACRYFLWLCAATAGSAERIAGQTWVWGICLALYIMGITLFARGESKKRKMPSQIAIVFLFAPSLLALAGITLWHQIDPIRQTMINLTGLLAAWIAFRAIQIIRTPHKGSIGEGVSRLLAGICAIDAVALSFYLPALVGPCLCCISLALLLQKRFAAT